MLNISHSQKSVKNKAEQYGKEVSAFTLYNAGLQPSVKKVPWEEYRLFALGLFEVRDDRHKIFGNRD